MGDSRMEVTVVGINIGTASGWDQVTDNGIQFYDFIPNSIFGLLNADIYIDTETGVWEQYNEEGTEVINKGIFIDLVHRYIVGH